MPAPVAIRAWKSGKQPELRDGCWRLRSERQWVLEGPRDKLADIEKVLPTRMWARAGEGALVLNLVNSVGRLALPHVGAPVDLRTGKLGEEDFQALLADLTRVATSLPFSAGEPASSPYMRGPAPRDEVLYHAFVYLRYILSDDAPADGRLIPALDLTQRAPYRRWQTERWEVGIEALTRVDERTLWDLVTRSGAPAHSPSLSAAGAALASRLGGQLPETVSERRIRATLDTPENRFVKAFIGQASGIIARTRSEAEGRRDAFARRLLDDCNRMDAALQPILRHSMWQEVGTLQRIPFSSTVLQRRRGYRQVLRHFARIRLAPRIPLDHDEMRDLLELKDIALLYELWTFFRLADIIRDLLGPPTQAARPVGDAFDVFLKANRTFEWASGVRLAYNPSFSRARKPPYRSYSVGLRPDIALHVPDGRNCGLHLLDAKFRLQTLGEAGIAGRTGDATADREAADEKTAERRGDFKHGDLYKMHTYRDAIPDAHSVWILYPGSEFRFYAASGSRPPSESPENLPDEVKGVGAIPFAATPRTDSAPNPHVVARRTLRRLLDRR
ncbi:DUF2357 domain-containing protein [Candidatus Palauibacter sp.]|uniref:DUF2357 domain-containing protein n=1 Tax=Candidatus Palauibacter sp. TaxID=3101350 RepID=UPI003B010D1A